MFKFTFMFSSKTDADEYESKSVLDQNMLVMYKHVQPFKSWPKANIPNATLDPNNNSRIGLKGAFKYYMFFSCDEQLKKWCRHSVRSSVTLFC